MNDAIPRPIRSLPSARARATAIGARLQGKRLALFLDYDGTLAAIAEKPDLALLDPAVRGIVRELAERCFVAVVSGRDVDDVRDRIGLEGLVYAGSHGFDIQGTGNASPGRAGDGLLPALDAAEEGLRRKLAGLSGLLMERKRYSLAVHLRQVPEEHHARVERAVAAALAAHPALSLVRGKKVLELRPAVDWDKGQAVLWLLRFLGCDMEQIVPIYIGDDITDEDAFRALRGRGIGIVVGNESRESLADYRLGQPEEVRAFLAFLTKLLDGGQAAAPPRPASA